MTAFTTNQDSNGRKPQMFSKIRKRLTYANVAMTLALVFAMTGGAYAAKKYLITSTKQISPKVLKSLQGKAGPAGAQGPAGPQGPAGANGAKGETGAAGKDGAQGEEGPAGPAGATGAAGVKGAAGAAGPAGSTGPTGTTGSPWTAGGTLPKESTETGSFAAITNASGTAYVPLSFSIPLAAPLTFLKVKIAQIPGAAATVTATLENGSKLVTSISGGVLEPGSAVTGEGIPASTTVARKITNEEVELSAEVTGLSVSPKAGVAITATPTAPPTQCENAGHTGSAGPENPEAEPGYLCIFLARDGALPELRAGLTALFTYRTGSPAEIGFTALGASTSGAALPLSNGGSEKEVLGTWAVTAP